MVEVMAKLLRAAGYFVLGSIPVSFVFFLGWVLSVEMFILTMAFIALSGFLGLLFWSFNN
jgi:hypothetical protein